MKETLIELKEEGQALRSFCSDLSELIKLRLTLLVLFTTVAGFFLARNETTSHLLLIYTLIGTAAVASGAAVLNQLLERHSDAKMNRTKSRPLPAGRIHDQDALFIGIILSGLGLAFLVAAINFLTALVAFITLISYLFVYTPLKKITSLNTLIGAIPGALPPVIGWTAVTNQIDSTALALFGILFLWQLPHFLAIAWIYKEDYARGGFQMLTGKDTSGKNTAFKSTLYAFLLIPISITPYFCEAAGIFYLTGALILSGAYAFYSLMFWKNVSNQTARKLFLCSILYLPLILGLLLIDKI